MAATTATEAPEARTQPERPDVFISYSRTDEEFVRSLAEALESRDKDVWVDWEDIRKTADWRDRIQAGIRDVDTGRIRVELRSPAFSTLDTKAAYSRDGRFVVTGDGEAVRVWDANRGGQIEAFHGGGDGGIQFSPDGGWCWRPAESRARSTPASCADRSMRSWRRRSGESTAASAPNERRLFLNE